MRYFRAGLFGFTMTLAGVSLPASRAQSADCNGNKVSDARDIADGTSRDCNGNGVPDECDLRPWKFGLKTSLAIPLGSGPAWAASADLDGDGDLDLITANYGADYEPGNTVSLLPNKGDGTFAAPRIIRVHAGPRHVAPVDLNGDGLPDLVTESADIDNDGAVDVSDAVALIGYLFLSGPAPAPPGPPGRPCGPDPDAPGSPRDLGCSSYDRC